MSAFKLWLDSWGEPKRGRAKGGPLAGCVWRFNDKRKMHLQGPRPWWWVTGRCLCRCGFAATIVRIISNSGSVAMVAKILSLMIGDNSEVLGEDKEYMKAIANRVPIGPSDCNRGMYVWPSTVGPKANERRGKGRAAPKLCKRPQGP